MKSNTINISYLNSKGQIVIPSEFRQRLQIDSKIPLLFQLCENIITITPVVDIITKTSTEDSYLDILKQTKGKWGKVKIKNKKIEINASKRRKKAW